MQINSRQTQISAFKLADVFIWVFSFEFMHFDPKLTNKLSISSI